MRVLIACEFSGAVRREFRRMGHDAFSCDLLPADDDSPYHIQGDVLEHLEGWDLIIAHPPCTHFAGSGARWLKDHFVKCKAARPETHPTYMEKDGVRGYWHDGSKKREAQKESLEFVLALWTAPCEKMALENPVGMLSSLWRKPDQKIDPFNFGDPYRKGTCLWLRGLPLLEHTSSLTDGEQACWKETPSPDRWKKRSVTYPGIARAMAGQWG